MSIKNKAAFITFEVECRYSRVLTKYCANLSPDDLHVLYQVLDDLGFKIYDHYELKKYTPSKEDLEK